MGFVHKRMITQPAALDERLAKVQGNTQTALNKKITSSHGLRIKLSYGGSFLS